MNWTEALDKFKAKNPNYDNLSQIEKTAFAFGFIDGFEAAAEERDELLAACEAILVGPGQDFLPAKDRTALKQVIAKLKEIK